MFNPFEGWTAKDYGTLLLLMVAITAVLTAGNWAQFLHDYNPEAGGDMPPEPGHEKG